MLSSSILFLWRKLSGRVSAAGDHEGAGSLGKAVVLPLY
jgi:hypothetical protein